MSRRKPPNPGRVDVQAAQRLRQHGQFIRGDDGDFGTATTEWRMPPARIENLVYHGHARIERVGSSVFAVWVPQVAGPD